jgi:predicted nuclease of predicted toxin-antitoxin system
VKLFFDENLSPRLIDILSDVYPASVHVNQCNLKSSDDFAIWEYARKNELTIVTKDSDFAEWSVISGSPPKVVWVRVKNCTTTEIEVLLRSGYETVKRFIEKDAETCLIVRSKKRG